MHWIITLSSLSLSTRTWKPLTLMLIDIYSAVTLRSYTHPASVTSASVWTLCRLHICCQMSVRSGHWCPSEKLVSSSGSLKLCVSTNDRLCQYLDILSVRVLHWAGKVRQVMLRPALCHRVMESSFKLAAFKRSPSKHFSHFVLFYKQKSIRDYIWCLQNSHVNRVFLK